MISLGEFPAQYHEVCEGQPVTMTIEGLRAGGRISFKSRSLSQSHTCRHTHTHTHKQINTQMHTHTCTHTHNQSTHPLLVDVEPDVNNARQTMRDENIHKRQTKGPFSMGLGITVSVRGIFKSAL